MSSIGLGKPPVIYPTPLDNPDHSGGGGNTTPNRPGSSRINFSPKLTSVNRSMSSPLISRYSKRRIKKLSNKAVFSSRTGYNNSKGHKKNGSVGSASSGTATASSKYDGNRSIKRKDNIYQQLLLSGNRHRINPIYIKDTEEYKLHLIRKIFLPKVPLDANVKDYLPALTSSSAVDVELYCFIGLLFKNFVNEWYFKITENDEFISEVIDVVAHITRNLESRVRAINYNDLILDYIPYILDHHRQLYCYCLDNLDSQYIQFTSMDEAFDAVNNHPALSLKFKQRPHKYELSAEDELNYNFTFNETLYNETIDQPDYLAADEYNRLEENYLSMLSKGALALLLPVDVSDSELARYFVRSVMSNIVLSILTKQLSEPDIVYKILIQVFKAIGKPEKYVKEEEQESGKVPAGNLKRKNNKLHDDQLDAEIPATLKGRMVNFFRTVGHFIAYSTSLDSTSTSSRGSNDVINSGVSSSNSKKSTKHETQPPIVDRYLFNFLNNLFNFAIENPILYLIMKYFSLWFLSYNIEEILNVKKMSGDLRNRSKSVSSAISSGSADPQQQQQQQQGQRATSLIQNSISTIINSHLFAIKINKVIYNLFEKLVLQKFLKNDVFISSMIRLARNMIFPTDNQMGPPRKIPNDEELEEMKIELFILMKKNIPYWFKLFVFNEVGDDTDDYEKFHKEQEQQQKQNEEAIFADDDLHHRHHPKNLLGHDYDTTQHSKFRLLVKSKTDWKFYKFIESFKYQKFNKFLIYNLVDHLFLELFPEMKDLTPSLLEKHE